MKVPEQQSCGFGNAFESFYEKGVGMNTHMGSKLNNCLPYQSHFGKRKRFIQKAFKTFEKKGTKGSFTRWCKRNGYPKVTTACINRAKKNKNLTIRRKAIFAQNIRSKGKKYAFGAKIKRQCIDYAYKKKTVGYNCDVSDYTKGENEKVHFFNKDSCIPEIEDVHTCTKYERLGGFGKSKKIYKIKTTLKKVDSDMKYLNSL
jgi:hypothetical protein